MKLNLKLLLSVLGLATIPFFLASSVFAVRTSDPVDIGDKFGYGYIISLGEAISRLVIPAFSVASLLVVGYFLFGAFNYLTAGGDKEKVASAQNMITHAIIGLVLLLLSFLILPFIFNALGLQFNLF